MGPNQYQKLSLLNGLDGKVMKSQRTATHQTKKSTVTQITAFATHFTKIITGPP